MTPMQAMLGVRRQADIGDRWFIGSLAPPDDEPDLAVVVSSPRQPCVAGQEGYVEELGQCDVSRVIGGDVVPELPDPRQQRLMLVADDAELCEACQCCKRRRRFGVPPTNQPTQGRDHLDIDQVGSVERLTPQQLASLRTRAPLVGHRADEDAGIADDHDRLSRSARMISAALVSGADIPLLAARANTSARVGRATTSSS